jgi:hypothetical protein
MGALRSLSVVARILALCLAAVGCAAEMPEPASPISTTGSALPVATSTPVPTPTLAPVPTPTAEPVQVVILHTNDNWGETEPCG